MLKGHTFKALNGNIQGTFFLQKCKVDFNYMNQCHGIEILILQSRIHKIILLKCTNENNKT